MSNTCHHISIHRYEYRLKYVISGYINKPDTYLCLACCSAFLLLSSSSLLLASSSWVRGLGAGLGGMAGSWMKGCEGWTWADDEQGMAGDTEEGLFRSWADTQGCTAPGRSTEVGRGDSLLAPVLLELLVLPLEKQQGGLDLKY